MTLPIGTIRPAYDAGPRHFAGWLTRLMHFRERG